MTAYARHSMSKASKERALAKAFKEADKDGSGSLTLDEYLAVFRDQGVNMTREAAAAFFREKDRDLDGQISYEEFLGKASTVYYKSVVKIDGPTVLTLIFRGRRRGRAHVY